jgi:hypothetical protein
MTTVALAGHGARLTNMTPTAPRCCAIQWKANTEMLHPEMQAGISSERSMHKFNARNLLIFVIGLIVAVVLIGLGTAYFVQFKQRVLSGHSNNALTQLTQTGCCDAASRLILRNVKVC